MIARQGEGADPEVAFAARLLGFACEVIVRYRDRRPVLEDEGVTVVQLGAQGEDLGAGLAGTGDDRDPALLEFLQQRVGRGV